MEPGEAALRVAARVRAHAVSETVWAFGGGRERNDPRGPVGESVGADVGQHLSTGSAEEFEPRLRPDGDPAGEEGRSSGDGALRRELLQVAGIRTVAGDVLGAIAVPETEGP